MTKRLQDAARAELALVGRQGRPFAEPPIAALQVRDDLLGDHLPVNGISLSTARLRLDLR